MSMLGDINYNLKAKQYELVLCKPTREPIAYLTEAEEISYTNKLSAVNELSFKIPSSINKEGKVERNENFDLLKEDYLILVNDEEYFMVVDPEDAGGSKKDYKNVTCYSLEYELTKKKVLSYNVTSRKLYDMTDTYDDKGFPYGILNYIEEITSWKVDILTIPVDLLTKFRSFNFSEKTVLDILQEVQKAFECLFLYDTITRTITIKDVKNLGTNRGLYLSPENYLKSLNKKTKNNEIVTRLRCFGKNNISIYSVNPTGTDYIENFSYYKNLKYMNQDLIDALNNYETLVASKTGEVAVPYYGLGNIDLHNRPVVENADGSISTVASMSFNEDDKEVLVPTVRIGLSRLMTVSEAIDWYHLTGEYLGKFNTITEADAYAEQLHEDQESYYETHYDTFNYYLTQLKLLNEKMSNLYYAPIVGLKALELDLLILEDNKNDTLKFDIVEGHDNAYWTQKVNEKQMQIDAKNTEINAMQAGINSINTKVSNLKKLLKKENYFTTEQLVQLNYLTREQVWKTDFYTDPMELYNEGKNKMLQLAQPPVEFSINIIDFMQIVEKQHDWDKLILGDIINISYPNFNFYIEVRLIKYTHRPQSKDLQLEFSNKNSIDDPYNYLSDILKSSITTSTSVNFSKDTWDKSDDNSQQIDNILNNAWDTAKTAIKGGRNQNIVFNEKGLFLKDSRDENQQIGMLNNLIAMTTDNWGTAKLAITPNGIYAPALYSTITVSEVLNIVNSSGTFSVDANGVTLDGMALTINGGIQESQLSEGVANAYVKLGTYYNNLKFDAKDGIVVTRNDNTVKVTINATEGLKYEQSSNNGDTWTKTLYYDEANRMLVVNGFIRCQDLQDLNGMSMLDSTKKIKADYLQVKGLQVINSGGETTLQIDSNGNISLKGNITMSSGSITWNNVQKPTYIASEVGARANTWNPDYSDVTGVKPPSDADNTYYHLRNNTNIRGFYYNSITGKLELSADYISAGVIDAGKINVTNLNANNITSGTISADRIDGGTISGVTIDVDTDASVGNSLTINEKLYFSTKSYTGGILWGNNVQIYSDPFASSLCFSALGGVFAGTQRLDQPITAKFA